MIKVKIVDKGLQNLLKQLSYKTNTKTLCRSLNGILLDAVEENFAQPGRGNGKVLKKHRCSCSRRFQPALFYNESVGMVIPIYTSWDDPLRNLQI